MKKRTFMIGVLALASFACETPPAASGDTAAASTAAKEDRETRLVKLSLPAMV